MQQKEERVLAIHREFEIFADDPAEEIAAGVVARPWLVVPGSQDLKK